MLKYFSSKRGLSHYLSMAGGNYREYLKGDMVKAKKYFYVLRPILTCRWILDKGTPPPMLFSCEICFSLDGPIVSPGNTFFHKQKRPRDKGFITGAQSVKFFIKPENLLKS